jgi:hypothetical protein
MATTAPMRAKAKVMTLISARSRSPTTVEISMLSSSVRAWSASSRGFSRLHHMPGAAVSLSRQIDADGR